MVNQSHKEKMPVHASSGFTKSLSRLKLKTMHLIRNLLLAFVLLFSPAAFAQQGSGDVATSSVVPKNEVMPIEIALLYHKLINAQPDYDALIALNPTLQKDPKSFGLDVLTAQRKSGLQKLYDQYKPGTLVLVKKNIALDAVEPKMRLALTPDIAADTPFLFPLTDTQIFGIFARNAKEAQEFKPPYEYDNFPGIENALFSNTLEKPLRAEILVSIAAADKNDFPLEDGRMVKPIIGDIVEVIVTDGTGQTVLIHKRFKDWKPPSTTNKLNLQEELMPILDKKARIIP